MLHRAIIGGAEIDEREGYRVTVPLGTLTDVAHDGSIGDDELAKAITQDLNRGLVSRAKLEGAVKQEPSLARAAADASGGGGHAPT